jgi:hypothetical protein
MSENKDVFKFSVDAQIETNSNGDMEMYVFIPHFPTASEKPIHLKTLVAYPAKWEVDKIKNHVYGVD